VKTYQLNVMLALATGLMLWASFPMLNYEYLIWFALVPLFWLGESQGLVRPTLLAYGVGIIFFGGLTFWVHSFHPFAWPALVLVLALYFALFMLGYKMLRRRFLYLNFFLVPAWWIAVEHFRSIGYWGFPWGVLGYSQWDFPPLLQISVYTGVTGLSFLIVLVNYTLFRLSHCRLLDNRVMAAAVAVVIIMSGALLYGDRIIPRQLEQGDFRVAIVQPNFPADLNWQTRYSDYLNKLIALTGKLKQFNPRLIIWPETVIPVPLYLLPGNQTLDPYEKIWPAVTNFDNFLLTGRPVSSGTDPERREDRNGAILYGPNGELLGWTGKKQLVPFGETLPGIHSIEWVAALGNSLNISDYLPVADKQPLTLPQGKIGVLICFESTFGDLTRRLVKNGSGLLINITNDVWSHSATAHWQHYSMSIFRAVENRCYLVRAANSGVSAVIDPFGQQLVNTKIMQEELLLEDVAFGPRQHTLYTSFGDWFPWLCSALSGCLILYVAIQQIRYYRRGR